MSADQSAGPPSFTPRLFERRDQEAVTRLFQAAWRRDQDPPLFYDMVCPLGLGIFVCAAAWLRSFTTLHMAVVTLIATAAVPVAVKFNRRRSIERYLAASIKQGVGALADYSDNSSYRRRRRCWVVEENGIVGFLVVQCRRQDGGNRRAWLPPHGPVAALAPSAAHLPGLATVQWLAVDVRAQGKGVGSALLQCAEKYCRTLEPSARDGFSTCQYLRICCSTAQRIAVSFYNRQGYTEEHRTNFLWSAAWESGIFLWRRL